MISKSAPGAPLSHRRISILTGSILALLSSGFVQKASAVDGTWINNDNTGTTWSDTTNWLGGVIGDGIDSTTSLVHFPTYNITGATTDIGSTYTLDTARTLGNIIFEDLDNFGSASASIVSTGPQTLTLQTAAGVPTVLVGQNLNSVAGGKKAIFNTVVIAGTQGFRKTGPGYLGLRQAAGAPHTFTGSLRVEGGLLQLASQNVYTGNTVVSGGATLFMDYANANAPVDNPINILSPLVLGSDGSGGITRGGSVIVNSLKAVISTVTQQWASTTLNEGTHQIRLVSALDQNLTYTLGTITRNPGATMDFSRSATAGTVVVNATIANGASGIIGGWAVISNTGNTTFDWAINDGANAIAPFASYSTNIFGAGLHTNLTTPTAVVPVPNGTVTNTLRINTGTALTVGLAGSLTVESGGILLGQQSPLISGGTLMTGAASGELILHSYGAGTGLRIASTIANNGATPLKLIKAGTGVVTLTTNNTYTGTTYVGGGTLQIGNGFGGGATGSTGTGDIFLNGLSNGNGSYAPSGTLLFNRAGTFVVTNNVSGPGILAQGSTGTLVLNRQFNVRNLQALAGTIRMDFAAAGAPANEILNSIETAGSGSLPTGFLTLRNSRLEIVGKDGTVNRQSFGLTGAFGAARISITPGTGGSVTLNLGALGKFHNNNDGGGTIRIDMPATGVTVTAPNGGSTGQTAQNGIIVDVNTPWVTIGDNEWAGKEATVYNAGTPASSVNIRPGSSIPGFYTQSSAGVFSGNLDINNSPAIATTSVLSSLRFNAAGANTVTINSGVQLEPHGILVGTGVGAANVTIAGPGTIRGTDDGGANARDLPIIQNNTAGELIIAAPITNFDADTRTTLVKAGLGTLTLSNGGTGTVAHTFTDRLIVNEGTLKVGAGTTVGSTTTRIGSVFVRGGTIIVEGDGAINTGTFTSIGHRIGEEGTLTLRGNGIYDISADFNIGDVSARGTLNVQDNAQLLTKRFFIGKSGFAEGTVNLSGNGQILASNTPDTEWNLGGNGAADPTAKGVMNQSGTSTANFGAVNFQIGRHGTGEYNLSGGSVSGTGFQVLGRFATGVGTLNISGNGSWNANPNGTGQNYFIVGEIGTGILNVAGTGSLTAKNLSIAHNGGVGTVNLNGGTIDLQNTAIVGAVQGGVVFGLANTPGATVPAYGGVLNLNGGTLRTFGFAENPGVTTPVSSRVNFNGGTVVALGANPTFLQGLDEANLQSGGAKFDTNAFDVTIAQSLVHDAALGATADGGLAKQGSGELLLTGSNTYTGPTSVNAGALNVASTGSIASNVTVNTLGTLRGSGTIDGLVTVNGAFEPGTLTLVNDNLILGGTSTTRLELGGTAPGTFDRVTGINLLTLDASISVSLTGGFNPAMGASFDVFDFTTINATAFNLATELSLPALGPGLSWNTSNFLTTGQLVVVPEPNLGAALAAGLVFLASLRRRR